jgi:protease PrsW
MESIPAVLGVALAPIVVLFTIVFMLDRYEREPLSILILCFVFGVVIAVPVVYSEMFLKSLFGLQDESNPLLPTALMAFVVVALVEEAFKFLVLRLYAYPRKAFNEPYDGIMYAMAISMGFAAIENVLYVASGGLIIGLLRAFTAVPAHGAFAHMMGYFAGLAKFENTGAKRFGLLLVGLILAVIAHGLYDFFLMQNEAAVLALFAFVVLLITIVLAILAIRAHRRNSPFRNRAA